MGIVKDGYRFSIILRLISVILLLLAIGNHPYSYYQILRWVVSGSSLYSGWILSKLQKHNWAWFFFISGVLFNPIIPFYLDRSTWQLINSVFAIVFVITLTIKKPLNEKSD
jgi:FtsH-binding integral membrane protein